MSELQYSKTGTPFIHLEDHEGKTYGNFIFSNMTKTAIGYKYICFHHRYTDMVATKTGKGSLARTKFVQCEVNDSYTFNMLLKRDESGKKGVPQGIMPKRLLDWMKALIAEFTTEGIFPFASIKDLEPIIAELDIDSVLVTDSDRVREANKKLRAEKREAKFQADEKAKIEEKIIQDDYRGIARGDAIKAEAIKKKIVPLSEIF